MDEQARARAAYDSHLSAAEALAPDEILPYRIDPDVAIANVNRGVRMLDAVRTEMPAHLPHIPPASLDALPELALAAKTAAIFADNAVPADPSPSEMIAQGWTLRATLLPVVAGLAASGLIPEEAHANIVRGRGVRDMAEDCVALAQVFREYATAIAGKHPADPATIARAEEVGAWLLQNLNTRGARQPESRPDEVDIRDRMATLLVQRYSDLRAVAYYFHREAFADHVPPLMSRQVRRARTSEADAAPEADATPEADAAPDNP